MGLAALGGLARAVEPREAQLARSEYDRSSGQDASTPVIVRVGASHCFTAFTTRPEVEIF